MRYSATWLSMCWAATMCCPSWLVWICWAGPDGLLKALPYGIPETLHSPYRHSQTLNCYFCYCDFHYCCCYPHSTFHRQRVMLLLLLFYSEANVLVYFWDCLSLRFQRYCLCPTGCLFIAVFSGLSVMIFGMCNWGRMFPVQLKMVQYHYQQLICWHTLSLPRNNVNNAKKDWSLITHTAF